MMMTIARRASLAALLLAGACGGGAPPAGEGAAADSSEAAPLTSSSAAADSVVLGQAAPPVPSEPAAQDTMLTRWTMLEMPSEPWEQSAATPEALLRQVRDVVAAQLEEPDARVLPTRMLSQAADTAVALLTHPNLADDSVQDIEFRIHMRREGSTWRVTAVDRRERCRRGVAEGGLCS